MANEAETHTMPTSTGEALTLRALVTTKEAGVIIGKAGKHVADLREQTGVKAGVSKVVPGVHERVLSVSGTVEGIAKAYTLIVRQLLDPEVSSNVTGTAGPAPTNTSLRLLISHNLMGTIIGRQGLKIKAIQDASGARMTASKEMLPQSTERVVEVHGTAEGIGRAVEEIARSLLEDWERGLGTVFYHPGVEGVKDTRRTHGISEKRRSAPNGAPGKSGLPDSAGPGSSSPPSSPPPDANGATQSSLRTQNISIPSDMVGCIIGRQGSKITEIRRLSGSKISIAKTPHDETGERMFTIIGTPEANEKALFLLYNQLESEKERRVGRENAAAAAASPGGVGTE